MRITHSQVSLVAERYFHSEQTQSFRINLQAANRPSPPDTEVEISSAAHNQFSLSTLDQRVSLIKSLLESILGYEIKFWGFDKEAPAEPVLEQAEQNPPLSTQGGFSIESANHYSETESTQFQAKGKIQTSDGREIQFAAELSLSRSYQFSTQTGVYSGNLEKPKKDPLVINYATPAALLSDKKFSFDLASDGSQQKVSLLKSGSGFLALDKNGDGKINQGSELFGTQSGNGFADLTQYDEDKNSWIDAGDSIFAQLKLWIKDDSNNEQLLSLSDKGIGALFLGHAKANFDLNNQHNEQLGQIRASGIYLREDGSGGSMQQIDLTI
ncbi:hypothetical protein ACFQNF_06425 [Iodobacter arcticus]|uniref:VCBS repeat-containing protein n=1 Tax=Iodobacter arcticus TaxID=590593 RepID=A0ABW2QVR3_9NEIS